MNSGQLEQALVPYRQALFVVTEIKAEPGYYDKQYRRMWLRYLAQDYKFLCKIGMTAVPEIPDELMAEMILEGYV